jgi:hypothetical protein
MAKHCFLHRDEYLFKFGNGYCNINDLSRNVQYRVDLSDHMMDSMFACSAKECAKISIQNWTIRFETNGQNEEYTLEEQEYDMVEVLKDQTEFINEQTTANSIHISQLCQNSTIAHRDLKLLKTGVCFLIGITIGLGFGVGYLAV